MGGPRKTNKRKSSSCPHVIHSNKILSWKLINAKLQSLCKTCSHPSKELWLCLTCLSCYGNHGDGALDHSFSHVKHYGHNIALNMTSRRFFCYSCDCEVFKGTANTPEFSIPEESDMSLDLDTLSNVGALGDASHPKGLTGLRNLGNTCYMNSALQCLSNCGVMTSYFLNLADYDIADPRKARVANAYKKLMQEMWSEERPDVAVPIELLRSVQDVNPSLRGYLQQDTQELLRCLIDQLHEDTKRVVTFDPPYHLSSEQKSAKYVSTVADIFNGLIRSSVRCLHCEKVSVTTEAFQDLSLPIPCGDQLVRLHNRPTEAITQQIAPAVDPNGSYLSWIFSPLYYLWSWTSKWSMLSYETVALEDCLSAFFSVDDLTGDNMYSCENCKKLRNGKKEVSIISLPEVMCIHLKRFRHDVTHSSKISTYVSFPVTQPLDISSYIKPGTLTNAGSTLYNLTGVICHLGSVSGGHYRSYARNPANGSWYQYDDSSVREVAAEMVAECEAYVLFYTRDSTTEKPFRDQLLSALRVPQTPRVLHYFISRLWLFKLFNCTNPGPISNQADFLCVHGSIRPTEYNSIHERVVSLSAESWNFIYNKYGGGPAVNSLNKCTSCQASIKENQARQLSERKTYLLKESLPVNHLYAVNTNWILKWEKYVLGNTSMPPPAIDNKSMVMEKVGVNRKSKHAKSYSLRRSSSYTKVNGPVWRFLHSTYGGGPEVIAIHGQLQESEDEGELPFMSASQPEEESCSETTSTCQSEMNIPISQSETNINAVSESAGTSPPVKSQSAPQISTNQMDCDVEKGKSSEAD